MRVYSNSIVDTYLLTGEGFKVTWEDSGNRFNVSLFFRKTKRGKWKNIYNSWMRLGACMGEKDIPENAIACALHPGFDDDGNELYHPGEKYTSLLCALEMAMVELNERR